MFTLLKSTFALALVLLPCAVSAQVMGARVTVGGGMDAVLYDGSKYVPGYVGQLGLDWRVGSRGALRLGLMRYQQNRTDSDAFVGGCSAECVGTRNYGLTGLTFDGTFDLSKGRLRPYLLSGVGLYRNTVTTGSNYSCTYEGFMATTCTYTGQTQEFGTTTLAGGLHSGLGLSVPMRNLTLFTEGRIAIVATDGRNPRGLIPIVFGLKF